MHRVAPHCAQRAAGIALRYDEQLSSIARLRQAHGAIVAMGAAPRAEALVSLQLDLRAYAAQALADMAYIEGEANPVLRAVHDDRELAMLEKAMLAEFDPVELKFAMQWLIPAIHHGERVRVVSVLEERSDDRLAQAFIAMGKDLLCRDDYTALADALARLQAAQRQKKTWTRDAIQA
jgi:hypothetical protein